MDPDRPVSREPRDADERSGGSAEAGEEARPASPGARVAEDAADRMPAEPFSSPCSMVLDEDPPTGTEGGSDP